MRKVLVVLTLFLSSVCYADGPQLPPLTVRDHDGSPSVTPTIEIRVTNGSLTDLGNGVVSVDTSGGGAGVTGPGSATDSAIAAWNGTGGTVLKNTDLITGSSLIDFGSAGVRLEGDGDGALTLTGLGNGSDENLTINLDDTSNEATFSSSTGVTLVNLVGMNLSTGGSGTPKITMGDGTTSSTIISADLSGIDTGVHFSSGMASFPHDITVSGDDILMLTNTKGGILAANGTSFSPFAVGVTNGMVLSVDSSTATGLKWGFVGGGGGSGTPGGSNTQVQFNDSSSFGGDSGFVYNKTTDNLSIAGDLTISGDDIFLTTNTKGNLLVADGTNYNTFSVGSNGTVLSADSGATDGVAWKAITQHKSFIPLYVQSAKVSLDSTVRIDGGMGSGATPYTMWRLFFNDGTNLPSSNIALWQGRMDDNWQGGPLTAKIDYFMLSSDSTSTSGGNVSFGVSIWAITSGDAASLTTESYDTENTKTQLVPTVMSRDETVTIPLTNTDSLAAGDFFIVKLRRDGSDTITGDAGVISFAITQ